jgi:hypothetical protein
MNSLIIREKGKVIVSQTRSRQFVRQPSPTLVQGTVILKPNQKDQKNTEAGVANCFKIFLLV